jgi:hypothetical protein
MQTNYSCIHEDQIDTVPPGANLIADEIGKQFGLSGSREPHAFNDTSFCKLTTNFQDKLQII